MRGSVKVYYHRLLSFERTGRMVSGVPRTISVSEYGDLRHYYLALVRHSYRAAGTFLIIYTASWQFGCGPYMPPTPTSAAISPASTNGTRLGEFFFSNSCYKTLHMLIVKTGGDFWL
jgi:hypothetical protein